MKKPVLLLAFTACVLSLNAQVSAGPKAQINFATVAGGDNDADKKFKMGFNAGVFINLALTDMIDIQPEMLYSTRGYKLMKTVGTRDSSLQHNLSYIDFPFLAVIHLGDGSGFLQAGPQVGYLINDRMKGSVTVSSSITQIDTGNVFGYKTTEYSLVLGGGYMTKYKISASARVIYGLSKLYEGNTLSHNISIGLSVSYSFGGDVGRGPGTGVVYKRL